MTISEASRHFPGPACGRADARLHMAALDEPMPAQCVERPRGTGDVLLMLFHDEVYIDKQLYPTGSIRCWEQAEGHFYGNNATAWSHTWIHASGSVLNNLAKRKTQAFVPSNPQCIRRWFECILSSAIDDRDDGLVSIAIQGLAHALVATEKSTLPPEWSALRLWIEQHFREDIQLSSLGEQVGLRSSQFSQRFGDYFSCTPIQYIQQLRLHEARFLLRNRMLRVADIARTVGYEDPAYFSRLIKKEFGVSPAQLR